MNTQRSPSVLENLRHAPRMRPIRLGYLVNHPIIYQAPLLRRLALEPNIELTAFFCSDVSLRQHYDSEFGTVIKWDTDLLGGYSHEFLPALLGRSTPAFLSPLNRGLYSALVRHRIDALWIHGWNCVTHLRAACLARLLNIKVLFRGESSIRISLPKGSHAKFAFYQTLRALADGFLAIGTMNRDFYKRIGVSDSRITMVPYAVDNTFFQNAQRGARPGREGLRAALGLSPNRPIILYASKLTHRKRAIDLLHAYKLLSPDRVSPPNAYLLYVGDGEMRAQLEREIQSLGWNTVRLLGFKNQSEISSFYDLCDIFVLPSKDEPWGLVINEVLNFQKPVVVTDQVGCAVDLVRDGESGFVYRAGSITQLADALKKLCADPNMRERFGANGYSLISEWSFEEDVIGVQTALQRLGL